MKTITIILSMALAVSAISCKDNNTVQVPLNDSLTMKLNDFASFSLKTDLSHLSDNEKKMIPLFIEAAKIMDDIFWIEAYGNKDSLLNKVSSEQEKSLVQIHYGPWDRMNGNAPLIKGVGPKPMGANYYPADMTMDEFEKL